MFVEGAVHTCVHTCTCAIAHMWKSEISLSARPHFLTMFEMGAFVVCCQKLCVRVAGLPAPKDCPVSTFHLSTEAVKSQAHATMLSFTCVLGTKLRSPCMRGPLLTEPSPLLPLCALEADKTIWEEVRIRNGDTGNMANFISALPGPIQPSLASFHISIPATWVSSCSYQLAGERPKDQLVPFPGSFVPASHIPTLGHSSGRLNQPFP